MTAYPEMTDITVADINDTYKNGLIPANRRSELMRRKAENTVAELLDEKGYFGAIMERSVKNLSEGWDNFIQAEHQTGSKGITGEMKSLGLRMWGEVQLFTAVLNAFGEVNGAAAEKIALNHGASPGLAKVINVAADVGSGFLPLGLTVRTGAKVLQAGGKVVAGRKATKATAEAAKAAAQEAKQAEKVVEDALEQGLVADGVTGFEKTVKEGLEEFQRLGGQVTMPAPAQVSAQDEFTKALQKYRREMEGITERKTHEITLKEAEKLGLGIEDLQNLIPGTALKESEMAAYLKALDEPVDDLVAWAKKTVAGEEGAGEAMGKKLIDFFQYSPKFRAAEVTAGRSVEILKETPPMKAITDLLMNWAPEQLGKGDFAGALKLVADDIVALADQPGKLKSLQVQATDAIGKHGWARFNEVAREVYMNVLLARPVTAVRNFMGTTISAIDSVAERSLGSVFSLEKKSFYDRMNPLSNEGYYQFNGYLAGIGDGIKAYANAFKTFTPEEATRLDFIPHRIGGIMGRIVNLPADNLRGTDNFFKAILQRGDLYAQAVRKGMQQDKRGSELAEYVAQRINMPTLEMMEQAKDFALKGTYQNDLGRLGARAQGLMQSGPLWLVFPFMKTPMNLIKYGWNRTPGLQLLSKSLYTDILAGGQRADEAVGRLVMSNMMGMFYYGLAQQGLITGGGPVDPQLKRSWEAVNKPYSIKGKDGWYQLGQLDPATTPMYLMADFAEISNQLDNENAAQVALALTVAGTRDIVDKSYWRSVADLVDLSASARVGELKKEVIDIGGVPVPKVLAAPLTTVTSGGPLVASFARIQDPFRREMRSFVDTWRGRVPGFSQDLKPVRDGYGDPIVVPQALGSKWLGPLMPFTAIDFDKDPIKAEGARLQVKLPYFPWSIGGKAQDDFDIRMALPGDAVPVELSSEERDNWQVIYRNILRHPEHGFMAMLNSQQYKDALDPEKRQQFMNFLARSRNDAKDALLVSNSELHKKVLSANAAKDLPRIPLADRPQFERQVGESLDLIDQLTPDMQENLMRYGILDSGEERDEEMFQTRGPARVVGEIGKSIEELNRAAEAEKRQSPAR